MNDQKKPPYDRNKQRCGPEEMEALQKASQDLYRWLSRKKGIQGNFSSPMLDGIIGKVKVELWLDPREADKIFRMEETGDQSSPK